MRKSILVLMFLALLCPLPAEAWWSKDWTQRKKLSIDPATIAGLRAPLTPAVVPIRLHTGNFAFADALEDGADLRFVSGDDTTPLKYHIEQFDSLNEIAVAWVQLPRLAAGTTVESIWMYYGNKKAARGDDASGTYDAAQNVVLHFAESDAPRDSTAYANHPARATTKGGVPGIVGGGAAFDGTQSIRWPASASLRIVPANGMTVSVWIRPSDAQESVLFVQEDDRGSIRLSVSGSGLIARTSVAGGRPSELRSTVPLVAGAWQHVAMSIKDQVSLFVDGKPAGQQSVSLAEIVAPPIVGSLPDGKSGYVGEIDELAISNVERFADWIAVAAATQGAEAALIRFADGEAGEAGGTSYMMILLTAVTVDGWIVIGILMVMLVVAIWVMIDKALLVSRVQRANAAFRVVLVKRGAEAFGPSEGVADDTGASTAAFASVGAMAARPATGSRPVNRFRQSSLYRIYEVAMSEVHARFPSGATVIPGRRRALSGASISAIKAAMDATLVRESSRLNSKMVLLTIAISGGPFLGLLGTVMGVMITFAAIAAVGDVNVNSIAPGIAAALVATVAGLAVAIPALFGYNYLLSRIRDISADMQVFTDEIVTKIAEQYSV
ncbi:MAG: DUF2341 domain-containing protein [Burkholderiales bacterium]